MSRVKTFDSTGVAPNGVFYAGDANAIQDHYADLSNYSQTVDVGTLRVGESGLQLLRYSTSPLEARITAAFRSDGILRGLSGLFAGTFTTTQRDAIAAGQRPYGLIILNTTTNQVEINKGSDATPSWEPLGLDAFPVGSLIPYTGNEGSVPANWGLADGGAISRTTYAILNSMYSAQSYPFGNGDGSTTFNKPDMRGRDPVGRDNMGGTVAGRMSGVNAMGDTGGASTVTLVSGEMPVHNHGGSTGTGNTGTGATGTGVTGSGATGTGTTGTGTTGTGTSGGSSAHTTDTQGSHGHGVTDTGHTHSVPSIRAATDAATGSFGSKYWGTAGTTINIYTAFVTSSQGTGISIVSGGSHYHNVNTHTHSVPGLSVPGLSVPSLSVAGLSVPALTVPSLTVPALSIANAGSGAAHNNLQPYLALNYIVKLR